MRGFGHLGPEVEHHVGAFKIGLGVSLLGVDEIGELNWVSDEEDGSVVSDHVVVALLRVELNCESSWVAFSIGAALFATDCGKSKEKRSSLADALEKLGLAVLADVMGDLEVPPGAGALGVDDSLGDSFAIECGKLVDKVEILEQNRAILAGCQGILVVVDGVAARGCEHA